jgi:hypothetical protein
MMLHFPCVSLTNLSKMLGERYDTRNKLIARNLTADLLAVENDIIRINKLITIHRRHCQHCKLRVIRESGMSRVRPSSPINVITS